MFKKFITLILFFTSLNIIGAETKVQAEQNYTELTPDILKNIKDIFIKNGLTVDSLHQIVFDYLPEYKCIQSIDLKSHATHHCMLPNNRIALSCTDEILIYDINNNALNLLGEAQESIKDLCFLKDNLLASLDVDGYICIWNIDTRECLNKFYGSKPDFLYYLGNNKLVSASANHIAIWDIDANKYFGGKETTYLALELFKLQIGLSANDKDLIIPTIDDMVKCMISYNEIYPWFLSQTPDKKLFCRRINGKVKILDIDFEKSLQVLRLRSGSLSDLCSLSNKLLVCAYNDCMKIWDINSQTLLANLKGNFISASLCALSDGKFASFNYDYTTSTHELKIWAPTF